MVTLLAIVYIVLSLIFGAASFEEKKSDKHRGIKLVFSVSLGILLSVILVGSINGIMYEAQIIDSYIQYYLYLGLSVVLFTLFQILLYDIDVVKRRSEN